MSNIIIHEGNQTELSDGKRQQMLRESLSILSQGVLFGYKADFYKAFALYNVQANALHDAEGQTWKEFLANIDISERSVQRYLRLAQRIREVIKASGQTQLLPTYITQKDFNAAFEPFFTNGKQITLRGLASASADLATFQSYLDGSKEIEDKSVIKLLNAKNKKNAEQIERDERENKIRTDIDNEQSALYRSEAAQRGYEWDDDERLYKNQDGSTLTDKQLTEFTTSVDALRMLTQAESALSDAEIEIERIVKSYGEAYRRYKSHANDNAFHAKARERFQNSQRIVKRIEDQISLAFTGDQS